MGNAAPDRPRKRKAARDTAKERLRLILTIDRTSLSPRLAEGLKSDIRQVISRYLVIDEANLKTTWENVHGQVALVVKTPVVSTRRGPFHQGTP